MVPKWLLIVIGVVILLLVGFVIGTGYAQAPAKGPAFDSKDRDAINGYFKHQLGILAPGSIPRNDFDPNLMKALVPGRRVPMQLEKELQPLPKELESRLPVLGGDYARFKLGKHVLLVNKKTMTIADLIRNAGW